MFQKNWIVLLIRLFQKLYANYPFLRFGRILGSSHGLIAIVYCLVLMFISCPHLNTNWNNESTDNIKLNIIHQYYVDKYINHLLPEWQEVHLLSLSLIVRILGEKFSPLPFRRILRVGVGPIL